MGESTRRDTTRTLRHKQDAVQQADRRRLDALKTWVVIASAVCGFIAFLVVVWQKVDGAASRESVAEAQAIAETNRESIARIEGTLKAQGTQATQLLVQQAQTQAAVEAQNARLERMESKQDQFQSRIGTTLEKLAQGK